MLWQKKAQSKFTDLGRDSFVFQTTHPRGFNLIVYPYWMVNKIEAGWEYIIFLKGWEREWNSYEERDGKSHAASYMSAMEGSISRAGRWERNPDHPEFPVIE